MERKNFLSSKKYNAEYNRYLKPLIDEIFQQQLVGYEGYFMSGLNNFQGNRHINGIVDNNLIDPTKINEFKGCQDFIYGFDTMGVNEQGLSLYLLLVSYDLVILTGAMGSGKTATSRFVLNFLEEKHKCKDLECKCSLGKVTIIDLNFNEGFRGKDCDKTVDQFNRKFYLKLLRKVKPILRNNNDIFSVFIERIKNRNYNEDGESEFEEFVSLIESDRFKWDELLFKTKVSEFFIWLEEHEDYLIKIELLGYIIRFLKNNIVKRKECIILFFDNIDQLPEVAQNLIISSIFKFTEISKAKTLLNVRLTSFGWVPAKSAFSWANFQHAGPDPIDIILRRINHFLDIEHNLLYQNIISEIPDKFYKEFIKNVKHVKELLVKKDRLHKSIEAIGGNSVRRSLFLSTRFFHNHIIPYDTKEPYENDFIRAMLLNTNESNQFESNDRLICNIYLNNQNDGFSLMKLRILQVLYYYKKKNKRISFQSLIDQLNLFNRSLNTREFLSCINDLLNDRRRLIYIDGIGGFNTLKEIFTSPNESVYITFSGIKYLINFSNELAYIQESFESIEWNNGTLMPEFVDLSLFSDRIFVTRLGLRNFFNVDLDQTKYFIKHSNSTTLKIDRFLFSDIIFNIAKSVFYISKQQYKTNELNTEIKNWVDMLILIFNCEEKYFGKYSNRFEELIDKICNYYGIEL